MSENNAKQQMVEDDPIEVSKAKRAALIAAGEITAEDPNALAMLYVSPVLTLIGICDRQPEREHECLDQLKRHVSLFFRMVHAKET